MLVTLLIGTPFLFAGPVNGDIAAYLLSAVSRTPFERPVHGVYVGLLMLWPTLGFANFVSLVFGALGVGATASRLGGAVALCALGIALPFLAFGEVDMVWWGLASVAMSFTGWVAAVAIIASVSVSPTALALMPWWAVNRDRRAIAGAGSVVLLTVGTAGAWWLGRRGVWVSHWSIRPVLHALWLVVPVVALRPKLDLRQALLWLPMCVGPSDLPLALLPLFGWRQTRPHRFTSVLLGFHLAFGLWAAVEVYVRQDAENTKLEQMVDAGVPSADVPYRDRLRMQWFAERSRRR